MRKLQRYTLVILAVLAVSFTAYAITGTEMDDFEDGTTEGWRHGIATGLVTNVPDGGPNGAGDNFLRVESTGTSGAGSRPAVFNTAQWSGDYNAIGSTFTISMDVINLGPTDLNIRLGIEGFFVPPAEGKGEQWVSTTPFFLPAAVDGPTGWQNAVFELSATQMTQVTGIAPIATTLDNVMQMRIVSAATATWMPPPVAAVIGIDNVNVISVPVELESFTIE